MCSCGNIMVLFQALLLLSATLSMKKLHCCVSYITVWLAGVNVDLLMDRHINWKYVYTEHLISKPRASSPEGICMTSSSQRGCIETGICVRSESTLLPQMGKLFPYWPNFQYKFCGNRKCFSPSYWHKVANMGFETLTRGHQLLLFLLQTAEADHKPKDWTDLKSSILKGGINICIRFV